MVKISIYILEVMGKMSVSFPLNMVRNMVKIKWRNKEENGCFLPTCIELIVLLGCYFQASPSLLLL